MRICFFANARNVHIRRMAPALAARGHDVTLVTHKPVALRGVHVERFAVPPPGLTNPRRWVARQQHYLRGFLRAYDVVVVFFLHDWGFTPDLLDEGCLVASPRGSDIVPPPGEDPPSAALVASRKALLHHAAGVGVGGPTFARIVSEYAEIEPDRIELMPLGVDLELFCPTDRTDRAEDASPCVGFFKGFREVYGAHVLIRAIPLVLQRLPGTRFELVGDGPQLPQCQAEAQRTGIDRAIGWVPRQDHDAIPDCLSRWDVSVMPSLRESFGLAALESSAMGVPVVASRVGGLVETVRHDGTGLLVPPDDPPALADAIVALLEDPARRDRMGLAGRAFVRSRFELGRVLDDWLDVFQRAQDRVAVRV